MSARAEREPDGRDWRSSAVCRDIDPELFFPEPSVEPLVEKQVAAAKAVCQRCPVRDRCLAHALRHLPHGIAGGMTEQERRRIRAGLSPAAPHTPRWRALFESGCSYAEIAREYGVSARTVARWVSALHAATEPTCGGDRR